MKAEHLGQASCIPVDSQVHIKYLLRNTYKTCYAIWLYHFQIEKKCKTHERNSNGQANPSTKTKVCGQRHNMVDDGGISRCSVKKQ